MLLFVNDRVLVSARRTPLRSFDRLRDSVGAGERFRSPVELFAHLLRDQAATFVQIVRDAADKVDDVEDRLIRQSGGLEPGDARARSAGPLVKVQRLLTLVRAALSRLLAKPPAWIGARRPGRAAGVGRRDCSRGRGLQRAHRSDQAAAGRGLRAGQRADEPHAVHADDRDGAGAADDHRLELLRDERARRAVSARRRVLDRGDAHGRRERGRRRCCSSAASAGPMA